MEGVRSRVTGGLLALLALLAIAGPAWSQDSESDREEAVDEVLRDYRDDGVIDACERSRRGSSRSRTTSARKQATSREARSGARHRPRRSRRVRRVRRPTTRTTRT